MLREVSYQAGPVGCMTHFLIVGHQETTITQHAYVDLEAGDSRAVAFLDRR